MLATFVRKCLRLVCGAFLVRRPDCNIFAFRKIQCFIIDLARIDYKSDLDREILNPGFNARVFQARGNNDVSNLSFAAPLDPSDRVNRATNPIIRTIRPGQFPKQVDEQRCLPLQFFGPEVHPSDAEFHCKNSQTRGRGHLYRFSKAGIGPPVRVCVAAWLASRLAANRARAGASLP
jgi:hypothetical protein